MKVRTFLITLFCIVLSLTLSACTPAPSTINPTHVSTSTATEEKPPAPTAGHLVEMETPWEPTPSPVIVSQHGLWKTFPILPIVSAEAIEVYRRGLTLGNNPYAFSKVGDGEIASHWFLAVFDQEPAFYNLGPYPELADTIETFEGSFHRDSLAAAAGFNTTRILEPLFAMSDVCEVEESPLECELRHHHPSFAIISLGTNQVWTPEIFEAELRKIIEICLDRGVVPILSTKGDNLEGDHRINTIVAKLADAYKVPLWNFWLAIQSLPDQGLQPDGEHLTWAENNFSDPDAMTHAWPVRNLTALKLLATLIAQLESN
jgi:hypothetical protein